MGGDERVRSQPHDAEHDSALGDNAHLSGGGGNRTRVYGKAVLVESRSPRDARVFGMLQRVALEAPGRRYGALKARSTSWIVSSTNSSSCERIPSDFAAMSDL